jgi:hypothetical protein
VIERLVEQVEERFAELERAERAGAAVETRERAAVYGATAEQPERHFIGWLDDVNPDDLFDRGEAWGLTILRRRDDSPPSNEG